MYTKAAKKAVILCQGLVYNSKIFPWTEALPVLALFSQERRYSHLLLCSYSAGGTLSVDCRRCVYSWSLSNLLLCPLTSLCGRSHFLAIHLTILLIHTGVSQVIRVGSISKLTFPKNRQDISDTKLNL